jgi:hypothetical protein
VASPFRRASPAERAQPGQIGGRGEGLADRGRAREPRGRHAARRGGGLLDRHHGRRDGRLNSCGRHHGCHWCGSRRGRRRCGGGEYRGRRRRRARDGARAGRGGAMAAKRDRQRDRQPRGGEHSAGNRGARPEAHRLQAGVDRAPEPVQPRLTPSDTARYMGTGRFGIRRGLSRVRRLRSGSPLWAGPRWCRTRRSGAWTLPRWPRPDRRSRSRRTRRSAPWSRRTDRR